MRVAVVVPMYKEELAWFERISLKRAVRVLGRYPICFLAPEGLDIEYEHVLGNCFTVRFAKEFFGSVQGYNKLMMSRRFYRRFLEYDYILIHQLDAFVFSDQLEYFCQMKYDYIGAPWVLTGVKWIQGKPVVLHVGNGGFSLRNPRACCNLLERYSEAKGNWTSNEDSFFSYYGGREKSGFRVAPIDVAYRFSFEVHAMRGFRKNGGVLSFGCHGWNIYSADFYRKIFSAMGYELEAYYGKMNNLDMDDIGYKLRNIVAYNRLLRRLRNRRSLRRYLPDISVCILHMIGDEGKVIASILCREGLDVSHGAYFYDENDIDSLIRNMEKLGNTSLDQVVVSLRDDLIVSELEHAGLRYGKDFVSFWQEYIAYAEKLLASWCKTSSRFMIMNRPSGKKKAAQEHAPTDDDGVDGRMGSRISEI